MAHPVLCRVCKKIIDLDVAPREEWVMPSRGWYYHKKCYEDWKCNPDNATDEDWKLLIYDFLARDLKVDYNYFLCEKQREKYTKENRFTNKGIYFTLKYFYEIKHNSWEKGNGGIGIVPYVYKEATEYWTNVEWKKRGFMHAIEAQIMDRANRPVKHIKRPAINKKKEKYNLDMIEGVEDDDSR